MLAFSIQRLKRTQTKHYNTEAVSFSKVWFVLLSLFHAVANVNSHICYGTHLLVQGLLHLVYFSIAVLAAYSAYKRLCKHR